MIPLRGRSIGVVARDLLPKQLWPVVERNSTLEYPSSECAYIARSDEAAPPEGFGVYLSAGATLAHFADSATVIELPTELHYLGNGDVIATTPDGKRLQVLWRAASSQNSILITEQCDNYCLMCSQPPRDRQDHWLLERAFHLIDLIPPNTNVIGFTGGEPTIFGEDFLDLLRHTASRLPNSSVHILSNGRRFADSAFSAAYASFGNPEMMIGIPIYGSEPTLHDFVVQANGAFDETVRGILNLAALGQRIELRVVIHKQTAPYLLDIADFIRRNLPFVEQVALMGLEVMGLARANLREVWIDPYDYRQILNEAVWRLHNSGIKTMIYNHQLCVLERDSWRFAVRSISDWKNESLDVCESCDVRSRCGGFFHSAKYKMSEHIRPVTLTASSSNV